MVESLRDWMERIAAMPPMMQRATCCSFPLGLHYDAGGEVGGDLVPPHAPVIDEASGVYIINAKDLRRVLEAERHG